MDIRNVVKGNYLPYAKGVILSRAFADIDGFKMVQRRVLYDMYELGSSYDKRKKSARIVGDTMGKYHPHGDTAIYETLVNMTDSHYSLNVPYISGKGNFGDVRSTTAECAAMRYTEAGLSKSALDTLFDGLDENAVDFVDNFDETEKEPLLLPCKYPNILVNGVSGIGVGKSNNIPSWNLINVCMVTSKRISSGEAYGAYEMAKDLGSVEYPTGGNVHATEDDIYKIVSTGRGKVTLTGRYEVYNDRIRIYEIPYTTTIEKIQSEIIELEKERFNGVSAIENITGLNTVGLDIKLKRGADASLVVKNLLRYTSFRDTDNFNCEVIVNNSCKLRSVVEIVDEWVKFRVNTLRRIYTFRLDKKKSKEHLTLSWEVIKDNLDEFLKCLQDNKKSDAIVIVKNRFGLDDEQVNYLFNLGISTITKDMAEKKLNELNQLREEIRQLELRVGSDDEIKKDIVSQLYEIAKEFGGPRKTSMLEPIDIEKEDENIVSDEEVIVYVTKMGYIKKFRDLTDLNRFSMYEGDTVIDKYTMRNNEYILVFTSNGEIYNIMANEIESSRGITTQKISDLLKLEQDNDIVHIDKAGDYSRYISIIYKSGKGYVLSYRRAMGKRRKYINCYEKLVKGEYFIIKDNRFFVVTDKRKATYVNLDTAITLCDKRIAIRTIRINDKSGKMIGLYPERLVPDITKINLDKYSKGYAVKIGDDPLFKVKDKSYNEAT